MIRSLTLAAVSVLVLSACGSNAEEAAQPADAPSGLEPESYEQTAADIETDPALEAEAPVASPPSSPSAPAGQAERRRGAGPAGPMTLAQMQARTAQGFARLDGNDDGVVTAVELEAADTAGERGGRRFARADRDDDGNVTRAESIASVTAMFARLDANGDGTVTPDERPQRGGRGGEE